MGFEHGNKVSKGRPKGSVNKRTQDFRAVLEAHDFCPVSAMIECYREAKKTYDNYGLIYDAITDAREKDQDSTGTYHAPLEDHAHKYLKIAGDMAKDISSYTYPKLKAIEQKKSGPLDGMDPEQRLEAMKCAVAIAEAQIKD